MEWGISFIGCNGVEHDTRGYNGVKYDTIGYWINSRDRIEPKVTE